MNLSLQKLPKVKNVREDSGRPCTVGSKRVAHGMNFTMVDMQRHTDQCEVVLEKRRPVRMHMG